MKDYTFYIACAYALTAIVLIGFVLLSLRQARAADRDAGKSDA